jgi:hypothetical protein
MALQNRHGGVTVFTVYRRYPSRVQYEVPDVPRYDTRPQERSEAPPHPSATSPARDRALADATAMLELLLLRRQQLIEALDTASRSSADAEMLGAVCPQLAVLTADHELLLARLAALLSPANPPLRR